MEYYTIVYLINFFVLFKKIFIMEKTPKQLEFDQCVTEVKFDTVADLVFCVKTHYKDGDVTSVDTLALNLKTIPFQTAMCIACEYVRSVTLVDYEKRK